MKILFAVFKKLYSYQIHLELKMTSIFEVVTVLLLMCLLVGSKGEEDEMEKKKITQLQIGIKQRVPESECDQKSQKGSSIVYELLTNNYF